MKNGFEKFLEDFEKQHAALLESVRLDELNVTDFYLKVKEAARDTVLKGYQNIANNGKYTMAQIHKSSYGEDIRRDVITDFEEKYSSSNDLWKIWDAIDFEDAVKNMVSVGISRLNESDEEAEDREIMATVEKEYNAEKEADYVEEEDNDADGRYATQKTKPEGYLKGQRFVG